MARGFSLLSGGANAASSSSGRDVALKDFNSDYVKLRIEEHHEKLARNREQYEAERREKYPELYLTRWQRFKNYVGGVRDPSSEAHQDGMKCCAVTSIGCTTTVTCVLGISFLVIITVLALLWKYKGLLLAL